MRRIYFDGTDMGLFHANSRVLEPPGPFWGVSGLDHSTHTVPVVHNDSTQAILSIDAWIFQTGSSHPPSRLVNRSSVPATTVSEGSTRMDGVNSSVVEDTRAPNTTTILLGSIIPTIFLLLCLVGYVILRRRRVADANPEIPRKCMALPGDILISNAPGSGSIALPVMQMAGTPVGVVSLPLLAFLMTLLLTLMEAVWSQEVGSEGSVIADP